MADITEAAGEVLKEMLAATRKHSDLDAGTLSLIVRCNASATFEFVAMSTGDIRLAFATKLEFIDQLRRTPGGYFDNVAEWTAMGDWLAETAA